MADVQRGNLYSYDPLDIGIVGGLALANADERGPLDTEIDERHPLYDRSMFDEDRSLDESEIRNIDTYGVKVPIRCKKYKGVALVVHGRRRLRMARLVNLRRAARGEPLMRIDVVLESSSDELYLMGAMNAENHNRKNVGFKTTMVEVHRFIDRGVALSSIADTFGIPEDKLRGYLTLEADGVEELHAMLDAGRMSTHAAIKIVRAGDPDAQRAALRVALTGEADESVDPRPLQTIIDEASGGKITSRAARSAAKTVKAPTVAQGVADKRTQTRLLQAIRDKAHNLKAQRTVDFFEGAENMLTLIIGGDEGKETDPRLVELLKEVRKAMRAGKGK